MDRPDAGGGSGLRRYVPGTAASRPRTKYQLAVTLKSTDQLIGNCGVRLAEEGSQVGDIGYELSPGHWGRGYATEAARAIMAFGFETLHLHRIWAECIAENTRSARVLEKLGMQLEGRLREHTFLRAAGGIYCASGYSTGNGAGCRQDPSETTASRERSLYAL